MKTREYQLGERTFHLCLNGAALFDLYDRFGQDAPLLSHIEGNDKAGFENLCWMLAKLSEQGELVRRYEGHEAGKIPSEHFFRTNLAPLEVARAKQAVTEAVMLGFEREVPGEDERIDLGLLELEKKTAAGPAGSGIFKWLASFWG